MIGEFKISRASRRCGVENRLLEPGEVYYSVLIENDEDLDRLDIAQSAWQGPPENAIGWWKNRVPLPNEKKRELAPPEVLIELLRSMAGQPERAKSRYLLALLLLRKRLLKPSPQRSLDAALGQPTDCPSSDPSTDAAGANEVRSRSGPPPLIVESTLDGAVIQVDAVAISPAEASRLQDELIELIYRDVE